MTDTINEVKPEFLGACSMNPYHIHNSAPRNCMFGVHLGQMLVINDPDERTIQSGVEREFGKYTYKVQMPTDGLILKIIERYPKGLGINTINENPETIVVYEDVHTKEIGMIRLTSYCSNHQYFGFEYKQKDGINELREGNNIAKGTVFLDSPSIADNGAYKYGAQANVAYMTHPATSEDGILISDSFLPKLGFKTYETRVVEWGNKGSNKIALNLYGDENNYKPFPDIGECIREDGLLMALRPDNPPELAIVEKGIDDTMLVDVTFDTTVYANGPGGKVVDIKIHHDLNNTNHAEVHMDSQPQKYDGARRIFCKKIVDLWKQLHKQRGEALQLTPEFNRLIVECLAVDSEATGPKVIKLFRQAPLDTYRVEFVIRYDVEVGVGFKLTDGHGGKGVICQVAKEEDMPIDEDGNRADIVMDPNSTISRMNLGRLYEQYVNSASRDVHKRICKNFNIPLNSKRKFVEAALSNFTQDDIQSSFNYLIEYYKIVSPIMANWFIDGVITQTPISYLTDIIVNGVSLYIPTNNQPKSEDIILKLEQNFKPTYGPVSYVGNSGNRVVTKNPIRIGPVYFILLEKIGDDWSAVSSGKLQHFGVLSQLTKLDKHSKPARQQAVRGSGEAEVRILASYVGAEYVAELMDRNNNPSTHKVVVENILSAKRPTDIPELVDRKKYAYGGAKPLQLARHLLATSGVKLVYAPYKEKGKV